VVAYSGRVLWRAPPDAFGSRYEACRSDESKRLLELVEVTYGTCVFGGASSYQEDGRCANKAQFGVFHYVDK
jgi:hypothetical protein